MQVTLRDQRVNQPTIYHGIDSELHSQSGRSIYGKHYYINIKRI